MPRISRHLRVLQCLAFVWIGRRDEEAKRTLVGVVFFRVFSFVLCIVTMFVLPCLQGSYTHEFVRRRSSFECQMNLLVLETNFQELVFFFFRGAVSFFAAASSAVHSDGCWLAPFVFRSTCEVTILWTV